MICVWWTEIDVTVIEELVAVLSREDVKNIKYETDFSDHLVLWGVSW